MSQAAETFLMQGKQHMAMGNSAKAVDMLERARAAGSNLPQIQLQIFEALAMAYSSVGRLSDSQTAAMHAAAVRQSILSRQQPGVPGQSQSHAVASVSNRTPLIAGIIAASAIVVVAIILVFYYMATSTPLPAQHDPDIAVAPSTPPQPAVKPEIPPQPSSVSSNPNPAPDKAKPKEEAMTASTIYQDNVGLIIAFHRFMRQAGDERLEVDELESSGTCFAISTDGFLLTNKHVSNNKVADKKTELAAALESRYGGKWIYKGRKMVACFGSDPANHYECKIVHESPSRDVALLKIDRKFAQPFAFASRIQQGDEIRVAGFPGIVGNGLGNKQEDMDIEAKIAKRFKAEKRIVYLDFIPEQSYILSLTKGIVSAVRPNVPDLGDCIQIDAAAGHGNSGGPVLNTENQIVGILSVGLSGDGGSYNLALDIRALMDEIRPYIKEK